MIDGQVVPEPAETAFRAGRQARDPLHDRRQQPRVRLHAAAARRGRGHAGAASAPRRTRSWPPTIPEKTGDLGEVGSGSRATGRWWSRRGCWRASQPPPGQPTYAYRFSYVATSIRATTNGALHATEIPFVFADRAREARRGDDRRGRGSGRRGQRLLGWRSRAAATRTATGRPKWPAYSAADDVIMDFTPSGARGEGRPVEGAAGRHRALRGAGPRAARPTLRARARRPTTVLGLDARWLRISGSRSGSTRRRRARSPCAATGRKARRPRPGE